MKTGSKTPSIQKPFRCPVDFDVRLNKTKGALMVQTGARISDNQFLLELLDIGLREMQKQLNTGNLKMENPA